MKFLIAALAIAGSAVVMAPTASAETCASVDAAIIAHNNAPHEFIVPEQEAAADAYDQEAAALEQRARTCT